MYMCSYGLTCNGVRVKVGTLTDIFVMQATVMSNSSHPHKIPSHVPRTSF
jgi:hypothetical protein